MSAPEIEEPTTTDWPGGQRLPAGEWASKVPQIALVFWVVKLLTTGMGEAASDFLGNTNLILAGLVGVVGFAVAMWLQLRTDRYRPPIYWSAVLMVAVFGTMAADGLHVALGIPYVASTTFYAVALGVILYLWRRSEGTLSIHSIHTRRRETYYWLTVLATFALGTAAGDLTATTFGLGFLGSAYLFAAAMLVPLAAWRLGVNPVLTFWTAYVLTRPLGASLADWLGKPPRLTGLDYGDGVVTGVGAVIFVVLVGGLTLWDRRSSASSQGPLAMMTVARGAFTRPDPQTTETG
jgi:uncharacterized membrane-anchored protein